MIDPIIFTRTRSDRWPDAGPRLAAWRVESSM
jgi:hypothetical protein